MLLHKIYLLHCEFTMWEFSFLKSLFIQVIINLFQIHQCNRCILFVFVRLLMKINYSSCIYWAFCFFFCEFPIYNICPFPYLWFHFLKLTHTNCLSGPIIVNICYKHFPFCCFPLFFVYDGFFLAFNCFIGWFYNIN